MTNQLLFSCLLEKALKDWPETLIFHKLIRHNPSSGFFHPLGLFEMNENIADRYLGHEAKIIFANLHDSIGIVIHDASEFITTIVLSDLRPETIKKKFDLRMKDALEDEDLGWNEQDIALVKEYFRVNEEYEATLEVEEYEAGYWKRWPNKAAKDRGDKPTMVLDQW